VRPAARADLPCFCVRKSGVLKIIEGWGIVGTMRPGCMRMRENEGDGIRPLVPLLGTTDSTPE